jgi:hypothetical protein
MKLYLLRNKIFALIVLLGLFNEAISQSYIEGFENLANLTDWYIQNNSVSPDADWGGGDNTIFPAQAGTTASYLSVNYQSSSSVTAATLSNWLFTPTRTYNNGDVISFYTRTVAGTPVYPDRLEVRFSNAGNGLDCGTTPTSVGTFTNLLLTVNPTLSTTGYPQAWTQYSITISGLAGPTNGRVAFRYYVTNGGPGGANSNYIGIDTYTYTSVVSPPINDNCSGAINIQQGSSCSPTNGSVAYATESLTACSGVANNDVWYSFTANSTGAQVTVNGSTEFDAVYEIYSGNCANLTSLTCVDAGVEGESETGVVNNLIPGQSYYIRVHDWLDDIPNTMTFSLCVEQFTQCNLLQPLGSILESETCNSNNNGGCNSVPAAFQTISCSDTIFGNCWANNGDRDLDWYSFQINSPGNATWSAQAEFPFYLYIVDVSNCSSPVILASDNFSACQTGTITYSFNTTGNYAAVIAPSTFSNYPCGTNNDYFAWLNLPNVPAQIQSSNSQICPNGTAVLSGTSNTSYNWFFNNNPVGQGITYNVTQPGNYSASYNDVNGCLSSSNIISISNLPLDDASFSFSSNTVCAGSPNVIATSVLNGTYSSSPAGLVFANSNTGEIDMSMSIEGNYIVTFLTNVSCPNSSSQNFVITSNPLASFQYSDTVYCISDQNQQVILDNGASIGLFSTSSPNITVNSSTGEIDLSQTNVGTYFIYNTISASGACNEVSDSVQITIQGPIIDFPIVDTLCPEAGLVAIFASPIGGTLNGASVENNQFNTALGSSMVTYTYIDANGCLDELSQYIIVETTPNLNFGQYDDLCSGDDVISLVMGEPTGGLYSGIGVQNNTFNPSQGVIGSNILDYNFTTSNGCSYATSGIIVVNQSPTITFSPAIPTICDTNQAFLLNNATPTGGVYSGPGVLNGSFDPSSAGVGTHTIQYSVSQNGCTSSASQNIMVDLCSGIYEEVINFVLHPNPTNSSFYISGFNEASKMYLFSSDGKLLQEIEIVEYQPIDVSNYPSGNYLIKLLINEQVYHLRIIKN